METVRRTLDSRSAKIAVAVLATMLLLAVFGSVLAPSGGLEQDANHTFLPFGSAGHVLGTDYVGRDVLTRILAGAAPSVLAALAMVGVGLLIGAAPGVLSVFAGRSSSFALQRVNDSLMTLPPVVFAIAIAGLFANGQVGAIIAIGVLLAPLFFRVARAETLGYVSTQYVEAAQLLGASRWWVIRKHVLRKVVPTVAVTVATSTGYAVLAAASLGFLGLGVPAPHPTWGGMLAANVQHLADDAWAPIWPGLFIALTAWSLNALADALRDGLSVTSQVLTPSEQAEATFGVVEPTAPLDFEAPTTPEPGERRITAPRGTVIRRSPIAGPDASDAVGSEAQGAVRTDQEVAHAR